MARFTSSFPSGESHLRTDREATSPHGQREQLFRGSGVGIEPMAPWVAVGADGPGAAGKGGRDKVRVVATMHVGFSVQAVGTYCSMHFFQGITTAVIAHLIYARFKVLLFCRFLSRKRCVGTAAMVSPRTRVRV